mgnify:CR=1 FL=1
MEWKPKPISQSQRSIKVPVVVVPVENADGEEDAIFGFNKTPSNSNGPVAVTMSEKTSEASEEADETIEDQMQSRFLLLRLYFILE